LDNDDSGKIIASLEVVAVVGNNVEDFLLIVVVRFGAVCWVISRFVLQQKDRI